LIDPLEYLLGSVARMPRVLESRAQPLEADGVDGFFKGRCAHGAMIGQIRPAVKSRSNKGTGVGATFFPSPSQKG
jgi:hypothetical protein